MAHPHEAPASKTGPELTGAALAVLVLAFSLNFIGRGIADAFAALILPLEAEFGWRRSALTGVFATYMLVSGLAAPLSGWIFDRFGPRAVYALGLMMLAAGTLLSSRADAIWQIYLSSGVLVGLGASATGMVTAAALVSRWYKARLSTAIAVTYAGSGFGMLVMLPLAQALIEYAGWRSAWQMMGIAAAALVLPCVALPWARLARRPGTAAGTSKLSTDSGPAGPGLREALRHGAYWRLIQVFFFTALASYLVTPQVVALLIEAGMQPILAASAYGMAGLLSTAGIVSAGWFTDRLGHQRTALIAFASTTLGVLGLMLTVLTASPLAVGLYVVCFGLAQGARGPIVSTLSNRIFAGPSVGTIYGTVYASMAVGGAIGSFAGGWLHDVFEGYLPVLLLSLVSLTLAAEPFRSGTALMRSARALHPH